MKGSFSPLRISLQKHNHSLVNLGFQFGFKRSMSRSTAPSLLRHGYCWLHSTASRHFSAVHPASRQFVYSTEVKNALANKSPVVALESTVITHGMPYPDNYNTAMDVESIVRENGATPATVGIIEGRIHVGLSRPELELLAHPETEVTKTSRRDLPYVLSHGLNGGLTVSGTMIVAHRAGIPVFVTGGVGGVHRGAESSMDISADLTELGRTPIAVVSAGVKSILDICRTLEYLETEGVCVASFGSEKEFPAFFSPRSGFKAPYNVETPRQAAEMIDTCLKLGLGSGVLFAVPIPTEFAASGENLESAIQAALEEAKTLRLDGKEVTPFVLRKVSDISGGISLKANKALIKHNAEVGSQIALELAKLDETASKRKKVTPTGDVSPQRKEKRPVVIGGTNVDFTATFQQERSIKPNGATYKGQIRPSFGGVGRNLADCLTRLGTNPIFLSAVGEDSYSNLFLQQCSHMDLSRINHLKDAVTATYCAVLRNSGQLIYGLGDFGIHARIDRAYLSKYEEDLSCASVVVTDGNGSADALQYICDVCHKAHVPVFFEPTDMTHIWKLFESSAWKQLAYSSPNMNELRMLSQFLDGKTELIDKDSGRNADEAETVEEAVSLAKRLLPYVPNLLVTLGEYGAMMIKANEESTRFTATHYPIPSNPDHIVSVSGAGDCLAASVICGIILGLPEEQYMKAGLLAARKSLLSDTPVPDTILPSIMHADYVEKHTESSYLPLVFEGAL